MANVLVDESYLQGIANAIRTKNGSNNTYTPAQMATAIGNIGDVQFSKQATHGILQSMTYSQMQNEGMIFNGYFSKELSIIHTSNNYSNPCYIFEAIINYPYADNSWSGLLSFGGDRTSSGVIFVDSCEYIYYKDGGRFQEYGFGEKSGSGDFHIGVVCSATKTCLYVNKSLLTTWESGYLYSIFNTETTCRVGCNKQNGGEYFKGILKEIGVTVKDVSDETIFNQWELNI